jgi:predicted aconitase with swiveling domain
MTGRSYRASAAMGGKVRGIALVARGIVPAAPVFNTVNPIMVQGAALAGSTMMSGFEVDITAAIPDGATVELDPTGDPPLLRVVG